MDGYFQSTLAANSLPQNINRNNVNNAVSQTTRIVPHFPPTNKEFSCTELHAPEGIYPLLHETFFETIAPQFVMGTRASITNVKHDYMNHHHQQQQQHHESSEDESLTGNNGYHGHGLGGASLSMTPVAKSAALPIPNAATSSTSASSRRPLCTTSSFTSPNHPSTNGLQVLTSPQKIMTMNGSGNNACPYLPSSYPTTPTSQLPPAVHSQTSQQQFASGSYMMSSSHDLSHTSIAEHAISSSFNNTNNNSNNNNHQTNGGSVGSLSSLFGRSSSAYMSNPMSGKSTPQISTSIVRTMSTSMSSNSSTSKPKNYLSKTNSTFVLRFLIHENLAKLLATKALEDDFVFFNIGSSFIWVDPKSKQKEPLSRIVFAKSYPVCHDINETTRSDDHLDIIIGFSTGDIIWYDPLNSKYVRLNKGGSMLNAAVSMIKWIPGSEDLFVALFKNGSVMIMDKERDDQSFHVPEPTSWLESQFSATRPHKSSKYNPVSFWNVSKKGLTDFAFSSDGIHLALTGVDGELRIIDYRNERLTDIFSSYYGKLTCVDWSPDGRYILTGGEDDLVTLWSFMEKKMIARCQGHKSWITGVAFDRWRCDEHTYRFGSVGEDCNLIFWDFSFSALQKPKHSRLTASSPPPMSSTKDWTPPPPSFNNPPPSQPAQQQQQAPITVERKKSLKTHRLFRGFSSPDTSSVLSTSASSSHSNSNHSGSFSRFRKKSIRSNNLFSSMNHDFTDDVIAEDQLQDHLPVLHPPLRKNQAAILQPITVKAIHADPCVSLTFRENTLITTDRRGRVRTWGRP